MFCSSIIQDSITCFLALAGLFFLFLLQLFPSPYSSHFRNDDTQIEIGIQQWNSNTELELSFFALCRALRTNIDSGISHLGVPIRLHGSLSSRWCGPHCWVRNTFNIFNHYNISRRATFDELPRVHIWVYLSESFAWTIVPRPNRHIPQAGDQTPSAKLLLWDFWLLGGSIYQCFRRWVLGVS